MPDVEVLHNPSCSKSRGALAILTERDVDAAVVEYLKTPPSRSELERIIALIAEPPAELVRKDKRFRDLGLDPADYVSAREVVDLLVEHPELMERPVVIVGDRAVIARPPEKLLDLL